MKLQGIGLSERRLAHRVAGNEPLVEVAAEVVPGNEASAVVQSW